MPKTADHAARAAERLSLADAVVEMLLQVRRVALHHRRPRNRYVDCLRRDLGARKIRPVEMLLALSTADLDDGASAAQVTAPYYALIALLGERARECELLRSGLHLTTADSPDADLLALHQRETRAEAALNTAQLAALAHPDDPDALAAVCSEAARYETIERSLIGAVRARWARRTLAVAR